MLRRNEKEHRIHWSRLVLVFSHAVPPSTHRPRTRPDDVSGNLSSRNRLLRSPTPISMSVRAEVEASASGSASVSDLALRDVALELAGALSSSGSGCESSLPRRTSMTSPSTTMGSSSSGRSVACVLHELLQSNSPVVRRRSRFLPLLRWSRVSPGCDYTYASSSSCATKLSRFVQASVLHSRRTRQVHTILGLHPSVCV